MPDLYPPTLDDQIAEVRREIEMRQWVYTRRRAFKTTNRNEDDRRIEVMRAVEATLIRLKGGNNE